MPRPIDFPLMTERLLIRPMELTDAEQLLAVYGDADLMQHLTVDVPTTLDGAREWVQVKIELCASDSQLSLWTVVHRESGQIVGDVGLQHEDYGWGPEVGIGGRGNRKFWHQGLAVEASLATLKAGFEALELDRIGAETGPNNVAAQRLLARLGLRQTSRSPDGWPVYFITREEWLARDS